MIDGSTELFPEEFLSKAAFALLSSSTVHRYARMAKSLAATSRLRSALYASQVTTKELFMHAEGLWRQLVGQKQRDLPEVELALILATLGETAVGEVDNLLIRISMTDKAPVSWISALARRLYHERASNQELQVAKATGDLVDILFHRDKIDTMWARLGTQKVGAFISHKDTNSVNSPVLIAA